MASKLKTMLAGAAAMAAITSAPASALVINLIDIGGVSGSPAAQGFKIAARYWESVLTSNVTMNIQVGFSDLGPNILGGTRTALYTDVDISTYYALLNANATKSAIDRAAVAGLPTLDANGSVKVIVPDYANPATKDGIVDGYDKRIAPTGEAISNTIAISSSNLKALLNNSTFGASNIDANIQFSSTFAFDFNPTDGVRAGQYDFIGVAVHEIGHALGFLSGAEDFDYSAGDTGYNPDGTWWGYAADMFRYSGPNQLDWTPGTASYFSLNGGRTPFLDGFWSTGTNLGDGWQASHWKEPGIPCVNPRGIMNPYICDGEVDQAEGLDLALLDAIGWNTNVNVAANPAYTFTTAQMFSAFVPEPSSWALMIGGFGLVGSALRRRSNVKVAVTYA